MKHCPRATENLFSITTALSTGSKFHSNEANDIQLMQAKWAKVTLDCLAIVEIVPMMHDVGSNISEKVLQKRNNGKYKEAHRYQECE